MENDRFPLGAPTNRPVDKQMTPVASRPGWFTGKHGEPFYVEQARPTSPDPSTTERKPV